MENSHQSVKSSSLRSTWRYVGADAVSMYDDVFIYIRVCVYRLVNGMRVVTTVCARCAVKPRDKEKGG